MKSEKLKLKSPKTSMVYSFNKVSNVFPTGSIGTDPTTTCTTVNTSTHIFKV